MMTSTGQFQSPAQYVKSEPALNITFDSPWPPLPMTMDSRPPMVKQQRRERTVFSREQVAILEPVYQKTPYPDIFAREELALKCNIPEAKIAIWFKNRRAKAKQGATQRNREKVDSGKSVDSGSALEQQKQNQYRKEQLEKQYNQMSQLSQPILPSYGPDFPAPRFQYMPTGPANQMNSYPLLSQYQQYAAMYTRAQQYPHGYHVPGAHGSYGQFSQAMTPAAVAGSTFIDMQSDAERLIVVDDNKVDSDNITLDEMTSR